MIVILTHRIFKSALLLLVCMSIWSQAWAKGLVISDIDDTLKVTHSLSRWDALLSIKDHKSRFALMSQWLNALKTEHQGEVEFHYVSAALEWPMHEEHKEFLIRNHFPQGSLWTRPSLLLTPTYFKVQRIKKILSLRPHWDWVILVGDNGEQDPEVYAEIASQLSSNYKGSLHIFIRQAYDRPRTLNTHPMTYFVTTYELVLETIKKGLLQSRVLPIFEHWMLQIINHESAYQKHHGLFVFPEWLDCRAFQWAWGQSLSFQGQAIKNATLNRCLIPPMPSVRLAEQSDKIPQ